MALYEGFRIPESFRPTPAYAAEFIRIRDALLERRTPPACTIDCGSEGLSCSECLFGTCVFSRWYDVARFEACEQYLIEQGVLTEQNYVRKPLEFDGVTIPVNIRSINYRPTLAQAADPVSIMWCGEAAICCHGNSCDSCIYTSNCGRAEDHRAKFADYVRACGYVFQLPETPRPAAATMLEQRPEPASEPADINDPPASLVRFNAGFACWCDRGYGECPVKSCATCMCSTANPKAVEQFTAWAKEHGIEVTRNTLEDTYEPTVLDTAQVIDYSMQSEDFNDPYALPKLRAGDFVRLRTSTAFDVSNRRTRWFQLIGDGVDREGAGYPTFEMLAVMGIDTAGHLFEPDAEHRHHNVNGLALGFIYTLEIAHNSGDLGVHDITEIYRFIDDGFPCGNGPGRVNALEGVSFGLHWKVANQ